jgi:hypothetical protein
MKLLICSFLHTPVNILPLWSKCPPQHSILVFSRPVFLPCVQESYIPVEKKKENYILYILNLVFLGSK